MTPHTIWKLPGASPGKYTFAPDTARNATYREAESGSLRVKVYAGQDKPLRTDLYLRQRVTAGPDAQDRAEELRKKFVIKVATGGHPKSDANVDQVMVAYLSENKKLVRKRGLARSVLDVGAWLSCHIQDDRRLNPASYRSACRTTPSGVRHRARRTRWSATGKWRWSSGVCSRC